MSSGTRKTALLLVTDVTDTSITIESLEANGANDQTALGNVFINNAQADEVLTLRRRSLGQPSTPRHSGRCPRRCRRQSAPDLRGRRRCHRREREGPGKRCRHARSPTVCSPHQLRTLALANLQEIIASNPEIGDVLKYDGTTWVSAPEAGSAAMRSQRRTRAVADRRMPRNRHRCGLHVGG